MELSEGVSIFVTGLVAAAGTFLGVDSAKTAEAEHPARVSSITDATMDFFI